MGMHITECFLSLPCLAKEGGLSGHQVTLDPAPLRPPAFPNAYESSQRYPLQHCTTTLDGHVDLMPPWSYPLHIVIARDTLCFYA